MDIVTSQRSLRRWAVASLAANMLIVVSGALVRLTKSGLGCPTWPECEPGSYVPRPELGIHGAIEFGNRLVTFVLIAVAIGMALAAWRARDASGQPRRLLRTLSIVVGLGIVAQAIIGGLSVWSQLNPWVVGLHMVASVALIVLCTRMVHEAFDLQPVPVSDLLGWLVRAIFALSLMMMYLGTIVTGAGPHSGDGGAARNGFALSEVARMHSVAMWLTLGLTVVAAVMAGEGSRLRRAAYGVLGVSALQAAIGYAQYFNALPMGLVLAHLLGTTLFTVAVSHLFFSVTAGGQPSKGSSAAAMKTTAR